MRPQRSNRRTALGVLVAIAFAGAAGCSDNSQPTLPPRPVQPAAKPAAPAAVAAVQAPAAPPYVYETKARRDPFLALIKPKAASRTRPKTGLAALDIKELKLAGIIWGGRGYFALVEAPNGAGYVVRMNDAVGEDARVAKITPDAITFEVRTSPVPQAQARLVELRIRKEE